MSSSLFDPTAVFSTADSFAARLTPKRAIAIEGPPGSGRDMLVDRISTKLGSQAIIIRLPSMDDADVPIHAALQGAAAVSVDAVAQMASGAVPLVRRFARLVSELADSQRPVILHVPEYSSNDREANGDNAPTPAWLDVLIRYLQRAESVPLGLVVPEHTLQSFGRHRIFHRERLPVAGANLDALRDASLWGDYADFAERLALPLRRIAQPVGPLQVRLMVGLIALDVPPTEVVTSLQGARPTQLEPLVRRYENLLRSPRYAELRRSIRRLLLARQPLAPDQALQLAQPPTGYGPLLQHCLGYGEKKLRVAPYVRTTLLKLLPKDADEAIAHKSIAELHASLDGASNPTDAARQSTECLGHWLEKVHHLAHTGPLGAEAWESQQLSSREFFIDRARALSIESRDYAGASRLYQRCLELNPKDDYSLHYLGYNLDRLGEDAPTVEECFRRARDLKRTNLFYNSRLVTFLIEQGRFLDAERAWQQASTNLSERDPALVARHVTAHVVSAWLEAGEVRRARAAFDSLPVDLPSNDAISRIHERLLDAEEASLLGISVYPAHLPMATRWIRPRLAPATIRGRNRTEWSPARIELADGGELVLTWVAPHSQPEQRRVFARTVTAEEWQASGGTVPSEDEPILYLELAHYDGEEKPVIFMDPTGPASSPQNMASAAPHPLRYLLRMTESQ